MSVASFDLKPRIIVAPQWSQNARGELRLHVVPFRAVPSRDRQPAFILLTARVRFMDHLIDEVVLYQKYRRLDI